MRRLGVIAFGLLVGVSLVMSGASAQLTCPAYPAFPDESCTGWQHTGVTLTQNLTSGTFNTVAGTTYDSQQWGTPSTFVTVVMNGSNITIKRSQIYGQIQPGSGGTNRLVEDVVIHGRNQASGFTQCAGASGTTYRRVQMRRCAQGMYAPGPWTLEDSWIDDLYGEGTVHSEAVLAFQSSTTNPIVIRHNTLIGRYGAEGTWDPNDGGMSAAAVIYTHPTFWPPSSGVIFEKNKLGTSLTGGRGNAGFCLYAGSDQPNANLLTNSQFFDNVWIRGPGGQCGAFGPVYQAINGAGNCWSNNRYDDGTLITSNPPACAGGGGTPPAAPINLRVASIGH
jgi:hypothetical protein